MQLTESTRGQMVTADDGRRLWPSAPGRCDISLYIMGVWAARARVTGVKRDGSALEPNQPPGSAPTTAP